MIRGAQTIVIVIQLGLGSSNNERASAALSHAFIVVWGEAIDTYLEMCYGELL